MTEIYCKSDCTFADNKSRICRLENIELPQQVAGSTAFTCAQYVKAITEKNRHMTTDIEQARMAGVWGTLKGRLR